MLVSETRAGIAKEGGFLPWDPRCLRHFPLPVSATAADSIRRSRGASRYYPFLSAHNEILQQRARHGVDQRTRSATSNAGLAAGSQTPVEATRKQAWLGSAVLAAAGIDAAVVEHQPLDRLPIHDV